MNTDDLPWYDRVGLHSYVHPDDEVRDMGHPSVCQRHPETGQWFTLRATAPDKFLALWDDGLGEPVIPCPSDHVAVEPLLIAHGFRLADSVVVRREDLVDEADLRSIIAADIARGAAEEFRESVRSTFANAEDVREAMWSALTTTYEPIGLVLHPEDHRHLDCTEQVRAVPEGDPYRRANQMRIADAFGIPHWMAGVEGAKAPLRLRARWAVKRLPRTLLTALPLVTYSGPRETGEGWMNDAIPEPRTWLLGVHVGNYRIGTTPHDPYRCGDDTCTEDHA